MSRSVPVGEIAEDSLPNNSVEIVTRDGRVQGLIIRATADSIFVQTTTVGLGTGESIDLAISEIESVQEMSPAVSGVLGLAFIVVLGGVLIPAALVGAIEG